jgi:hypothetical protein
MNLGLEGSCWWGPTRLLRHQEHREPLAGLLAAALAGALLVTVHAFACNPPGGQPGGERPGLTLCGNRPEVPCWGAPPSGRPSGPGALPFRTVPDSLPRPRVLPATTPLVYVSVPPHGLPVLVFSSPPAAA